MRAALMLAALFLAPMIGGVMGELETAIILLLIFAAVISHLLRFRTEANGIPRAPGLLPIAVFLLLTCISALFTQAAYLTVKQLAFLFGCAAAYLLAADLSRNSRFAAAAIWTSTIAALLICAASIRNYADLAGGGVSFWKSIMGPGEHERLFGTFVNPSFFAGFLVIAIPVALAIYLVTRGAALTLLAGIAVVLDIVALMLTGTKFGILAALAALVVMFGLAIATKSLRRTRYKRLIIIAAVLLPLLIVFRGPVISRIAAAEAGGSQVHSTLFRAYTWRGTVRMAHSKPWFGVGPGAFEIAYPRYAIAGPTTHAHQSYLQLAAENGIPAFAAFLFALAAIFRANLAGVVAKRSAASRSEAADEAGESASDFWRNLVPYSGWPMVNCAIFASLIGSALRNLVDSDWYITGTAFPFWILAGVLAARSGAVSREIALSRVWRGAGAGFFGVLCAVVLSIGSAGLFAPARLRPQAGPAASIIRRYAIASALCPWNPVYQREMAKWLMADGDLLTATRHINRAVNLSPWDSSNYYVKGILAFDAGDALAAEDAFAHAIRLSPNNTRYLLRLAEVHRAQGNTAAFESTLRRILEIEDSDYEQVRGAPELVDTTYAYAHFYFASEELQRRNYRRAVGEFTAAATRLERWRYHKDALAKRWLVHARTEKERREVIASLRESGLYPTLVEERELLSLLRDSYLLLAEAYSKLGHRSKQRSAAEQAVRIARYLKHI